MNVNLTNLYSHFEQLVQHHDDREALKSMKRDRDASPAQAVDRLGQLLRDCQARSTFIPTSSTMDLLKKIKRDLNAIENSSSLTVSNRITSLLKPQASPLLDSCAKTSAVVEKSLVDSELARAEFANWLISPDASDPDKVAEFVNKLKDDPKKLLLFFDMSIGFIHWSIVNENILKTCYEQLARFASENTIPEAAARNIAQEFKNSQLEHITCIKCWVGQEPFPLYIDKILLSMKCLPESRERHFLGQEVIMPDEFTKKEFLNLIQFLETGRLPPMNRAEMSSFVHALDFLGIPSDHVILSASQQYRSCMLIKRMPNGLYEISLKEPVAQGAIDLLATRPFCLLISKLDLTSCKVTDDLIAATANSIPNISILRLPYPNELTETGWGKLPEFSRLGNVEIKVIHLLDSQKLFSSTVANQLNRYRLTIDFHGKKPKKTQWMEASAFPKQLPYLEELPFVPSLGNLANELKILKECETLRTLDLSKTSLNLTDEHLQQLEGSHPELTTLKLASQKQLSNQAIQAFISQSTHLIDIDLAGTDVSDATIEHLVRTCANLRSLRLSDCQQITDNALKALAKCHSLQTLHIDGCPLLTSQAAPYIAKRARFSLRELSLPQQLAFGTSIQQIAEANTELFSLRLSSAIDLTDKDVLHLAQNCRKLVVFSLPHGKQLTDEGIRALADHCPYLEQVNLHDSLKITIGPFNNLLEQWPNMRELTLSSCSQINNDDIKSLERKFPHVLIYRNRSTYASLISH